MNKEEKRRKFHDSLLKMLYPPQEHHQIPLNISPENFSYDSVDEEEKSSSSSSDGDQQKLTRAQRKRLRKKKLHQAASQRRPIIGPLLPTTLTDNTPPVSEAQQGPDLDETQPVRHNAAEESVSGIHNSEEQGASSNQNKLKQRRIAKRLTRDINEQKDSGHRGL
ncbi:ATP-binding cassette sub-family F member 1 [Heracleum sosnowskyi]|uniref:ATP-binding cassette sub-family F member 1 n=1 Tax=Heracleum sosnowskyi TaxID=360622 RepID=A0AAD8HAW4_9APIA|nr:ATP-binding cassette sub-family F member 1 [Heracleum sosnowskyi]